MSILVLPPSRVRSRSQGFGSRSFVVSPVSETKPVPGANKLWPKLTTVDSLSHGSASIFPSTFSDQRPAPRNPLPSPVLLAWPCREVTSGPSLWR
ncbi:Chanoclavine-I aldehyde reductase fgaOx3 [Fusarium oxysporum f. sp. albedinis]|nr:Chanoclavine-I aldehyde reductase fgaOx3 [Fusarium oxysporum f. sp. albedinis]